MITNRMWFGNRRRMISVKAPAVDMPASPVAWGTTSRSIDGGADSRSSVAFHMEYQMTWNKTSKAELRKILDFFKGIHGRGRIYFLDPFSMKENVLSQAWSEPFVTSYDGPILVGTNRPYASATPTNAFGYPAEMVTFTIAADDAKKTLFIPIPPEHVLWIGAHGYAGTGGTINVLPATGPDTVGPAIPLILLSVTTSTLMNTSFSADDYPLGVELSYGGVGTIAIAGIVGQILPRGVTPVGGDFISGQGHSGCKMDGALPVVNKYNESLDQVYMTANLVEAW